MNKHTLFRLVIVGGMSVATLMPAHLAAAQRIDSERRVTVGQVAVNPTRCQAGSPGPYDAVQASSAALPRYVIPSRGTLTSWSTNAGADGGRMQLQVWRPLPMRDTYKLVAAGAPEELAAGVPNTFRLRPGISVRAGDVLGFRQLSNFLACGELSSDPGDVWATNHAGGAAPTRGTIKSLTLQAHLRINIAASLKIAGNAPGKG